MLCQSFAYLQWGKPCTLCKRELSYYKTWEQSTKPCVRHHWNIAERQQVCMVDCHSFKESHSTGQRQVKAQRQVNQHIICSIQCGFWPLNLLKNLAKASSQQGIVSTLHQPDLKCLLTIICWIGFVLRLSIKDWALTYHLKISQAGNLENVLEELQRIKVQYQVWNTLTSDTEKPAWTQSQQSFYVSN